MTYFFDDIPYFTVTQWPAKKGMPHGAPFDMEFHILLSLIIGGPWPEEPNAQTRFPADMVVDWVRVYQWQERSPAPGLLAPG